MFKKSRIKIVAAIMTILTILWIGTLGVIFITSYYDVAKTNYEMLEEYANSFFLKTPPEYPGRTESAEHGPRRHQDTDRFKLSTFYAVAVSYEGEVLEVRNDESGVYTNEEITRTAQSIIQANGEDRGVSDNLLYFRLAKQHYILLCFMDNTLVQESMTTLFRYMLTFGSAVMAVLFFLAVYLARRIVKPLEESYQKQKQFISDAGHELKTPISVVGANAEILSREMGDNPWLANIQYENERMGKLIAQLLELARTENVELQTEQVDFSRLVTGGTLPFESVAYEKGLSLNTAIKERIFVSGDNSALSQLVAILIDNAICHGKSGAEVSVSLTEGCGMAILSVINDGEPIPPEKKSRLFDRFYRADASRGGEDGHCGLGLAIAKAIVTSHHGRISVACGNGKVCFTVRIPKC